MAKKKESLRFDPKTEKVFTDKDSFFIQTDVFINEASVADLKQLNTPEFRKFLKAEGYFDKKSMFTTEDQAKLKKAGLWPEARKVSKALKAGKVKGKASVVEVLKEMPLPKNAAEAAAALPALEEISRYVQTPDFESRFTMESPSKATLRYRSGLKGGGAGVAASAAAPETLSAGAKGWFAKLSPALKKYGGLAVGAMFLHYVLSSMMAQKQQKGLAQTEMQAALMGMKPEAAANEEITKMLMGDYSRNREAYLAALSPNYPQVASGESAALGSLVRRISRTKTAIGGSAGAGTGGMSPEELMAALSSGQ